jgi:rRNA maturation endonuclease Nob1
MLEKEIEMKILVKCIGCENKKEYQNENIPNQQPFCEFCGSPMIAERIEGNIKKKKKGKWRER